MKSFAIVFFPIFGLFLLSERFSPYYWFAYVIIITISISLLNDNNKRTKNTRNPQLIKYILFLLVYGLIAFFSETFDSNSGYRHGLYLLFTILPLALLNYNNFKSLTYELYFKNLLYSYIIICTLICVLYFTGFISASRYQTVGNSLIVLSILILYNSKLNLVLKVITLLSLILLMLLTGSRQALFGGIIVYFIYFYQLTRGVFLIKYNLLKFSILITLFFILGFYIFESLIGSFQFSSVDRISYLANTGIDSNIRIEIFKKFFDQLHLFPKVVNFSLGQASEDLIHNFVLQYSLVCGLIIGVPFLIFLIINFFKMNKYHFLFYISFFYFITSSLSSGLTAAKYFIFFYMIAINTKKN